MNFVRSSETVSVSFIIEILKCNGIVGYTETLQKQIYYPSTIFAKILHHKWLKKKPIYGYREPIKESKKYMMFFARKP